MITATIDPRSMASLQKAMSRAVTETGRTSHNALKWGLYSCAVALAKRTRKAPKNRKVIADAEGVKGVMMFQAGKEKFVPLTAGNIQFRQFIGKGGVKMVQVFPSRKYYTLEEFTRMSVTRLKGSLDIVQIKRAKMAQESWLWMSRNTGRSSRGNVGDVSNVGAVVWTKGALGTESVRLENKLNYILDAMKNGWSSVNEAIYKAGRAMEHMIDKGVKETLRKI